MVNNFSAGKSVVKPPQRGIFPLDHDGECKTRMKDFVLCLNRSDNDHHKCRELSRAYLQCRMDKQLMAAEDLDNLGFSKDAQVENAKSHEGVLESQGFRAGKHIQKKRKWFWQS